jgi:hypothetical protein
VVQNHHPICLVLSLVLLSVFSPFAGAQTVSRGGISGQILFPAPLSLAQGTQEVILHTFGPEEQIAPRSQSVGADGRFQFSGLVVDPNYTYLIATQYQGVTYHSERLTLSPDNPVLNQVTIRVYDTTSDDSTLVIQRDHILLEVLPAHLRVMEVLVIANTGEKTLIPKAEGGTYTAYFPLPAGFQDFQVSQEMLPGSLQADQSGIALLRPVPPGMEQLVFSYILPYQNAAYTFTKSLPYPTEHIILLLANPEVSVSGNHLTDKGTVTMRERQFRRLDTSQKLPQNATLTFTLHNLKAMGPSPSSAATPWIVYSGVGLVILCGFLYPLLWRRRRVIALANASGDKQQPERKSQDEQRMQDTRMTASREKERESLLRQIVLLDAQYDQRLLDPETYRQQRQELKEHLIKITLQSRGRGVHHD